MDQVSEIILGLDEALVTLSFCLAHERYAARALFCLKVYIGRIVRSFLFT